ncbi:MAG: zf-HC2 domain-containing protein, partial [Actinobacteria bacterium]|nr:zf-HC2 domain-containing protein [Actinomycetota bacterium]
MTSHLSMWRRLVGDNDVASCREATRLLQSALDGQTDENTQNRVLRHLEACKRCGLEAETYRAIKGSLTTQFSEPGDSQAAADLVEFGRSLTRE